jgi:hypothetical protein
MRRLEVMLRQQTKNTIFVCEMAAAIRHKFDKVIKYEVYCFPSTYEMSVDSIVFNVLCIKQNKITTALTILLTSSVEYHIPLAFITEASLFG